MRFKIKKDSHYSNHFIYKLLSLFKTNNRMSNYVVFDESALYVDETDDKYDVNKLFGFSNGFHHKNSYRFGWNCIDGEILIYAYTYVKSKRLITKIGNLLPNKKYKLIINIRGGKCSYTIIDEEYKIQQHILDVPNKVILGYSLWPYFGGNKKAPHDIFIDLEDNS